MIRKGYFYQFWIQSSRGTDNAITRRYDEKPSKDKIKEDVEAWCENFGAWHVSENMISYGWKPLVKLPKTRAECLAKYQAFCKTKQRASEKARLFGSLLKFY